MLHFLHNPDGRALGLQHSKTDRSRKDGNGINISIQDLSRIEVSSSATPTPRSESSPSDPSGSSFDVTGSDMTGSISFNSDDEF